VKCCGDGGGPLTREEEGGGASGATAPTTEGKKWRGAWLRLSVKLHLHVAAEGLAAAGGTALLTGTEARHGSFGTATEASDKSCWPGTFMPARAAGGRRPRWAMEAQHPATESPTGGPHASAEF
jgi:hypothetical protein